MFRCSIFSASPFVNETTDFDDVKFVVFYDDNFSLSEIERISFAFACVTNTYREDLVQYKTSYDHKPHYFIKCSVKDTHHKQWTIEYDDREFKNIGE